MDGEHGAAGVDVEDSGGDLSGFVAEEIDGGVGGVLNGLHAAEGKTRAGFVEIGGGATFAFLNVEFAFGGDPAGNDVVQANAVRGERAGERASHGEQATFCGGVGDEIGQALNAVDGTHVDDAAAFCFAHARDGELGDVKGAAKVYVEDFVPKFGGSFFEASTGKPPGVIDEAVEAAEFIYGGVDECGALGFLGEIGELENRVAAGGTDFCGGFFATIFLNVTEDDRSAFGGGHSGTFETDALGCTGHEDYFS